MGDMANQTTVERIYRRSVSQEVWDQAWAEATAKDVHDTQVRKLYMTFRANLGAPTADTYLCVHADGSVCVDGKQGAPNTKFRVLNVFPIEKNYYQIICREGECKDFILYVENSTLKARAYCRRTDSLNEGYNKPVPTLFRFEIDCDRNYFINTLNGNLQFSHNEVDGNMIEPQSPNIMLERQPSEDAISFDVSRLPPFDVCIMKETSV